MALNASGGSRISFKHLGDHIKLSVVMFLNHCFVVVELNAKGNKHQIVRAVQRICSVFDHLVPVIHAPVIGITLKGICAVKMDFIMPVLEGI